MDRRTYFKQMALATGGILIAPHLLISCKEEIEGFVNAHSLEPFNSLEEIQHFVRSSPGHLSEEMLRLIKGKNAEAIFSFVQNRFATVPPTSNTITSNAYEVRLGQKGLLRSGKGTLREKSDLLLFMLKEAGFNPTFHRANFPMNPKLVQEVFCKTSENNDEIEAPQSYLNKWEDSLQPIDVSSIIKEVDATNEQSKQLTDKIINSLPSNFGEEVPQLNWLNVDGIEAPVVKLNQNGNAKELNFVENKPFNDFNETLELFDLTTSEIENAFSKLRVILNCTFSDAINSPVEIARGEWDFDQVLGNQIALQFLSPIPQEQLLETSFQEVKQFVPMLSLQSSSSSEAFKKENSFKGVGFDLLGNTFQEDGDGAIVMNEVKMNEVSNVSTSEIVSLQVKLLDHQYPTITLQCAPLDANGNIVLGLSGQAFSIQDQGKQQLPVIIQNTETPKILVFFDATASMPYPYAALEIPEETLIKINTGLESVFYNTIVETKSFELDFLSALSQIEPQQYDHIICVGDGEAFENITSEELKEVVNETGISYHFINNSSYNQTDKFVKKCFTEAGFLFSDISEIEQNVTKIASEIKKQIVFPYILQYEAPVEVDNLIHDVVVGINNNNKVTPQKLQYIMNREKDYETSRFPCGLTMTLEWDRGFSSSRVSKHLAGFNVITDDKVLPKHKEELRSFVLGTHRLFIEADKATLPVILDELLTSQLSVAPYFEKQEKTLEAQLKQINNFHYIPAAGLSIFSPLPNPGSDWVTFEDNFQTCLYSEYIDFENQTTNKKVDVWPTSNVITFDTSKENAFIKTLEATSLLAISEATLFTKSTKQLLQNKPISFYQEGGIDFREHPNWYPLYDKSYLNYLLYDTSFSTEAYWQIKKSTGAILGILPDGSGGGIEEAIAHNLRIIDSYAGAYNKAAAPLMSDPLAFGTVTMYGQFLARLYGLVCVAVLSLDAAQLPPKSRQAVKKLAYGVIKSFAFAKFGKLKNFEKILDKLFDPGWPKIK